MKILLCCVSNNLSLLLCSTVKQIICYNTSTQTCTCAVDKRGSRNNDTTANSSVLKWFNDNNFFFFIILDNTMYTIRGIINDSEIYVKIIIPSSVLNRKMIRQND